MIAAGDTPDRFEKPIDVGTSGAQPCAGPDRSGHPAAVAAKHVIAVLGDVFAGKPEETGQVGVRAEASVPDPDRILGGEPRRH